MKSELSKIFLQIVSLLVSIFVGMNQVFADGYNSGLASHQTLYADTVTSRTDGSAVSIADNQGLFVGGLITTLSNAGIGNTNPLHTLEVGSSSHLFNRAGKVLYLSNSAGAAVIQMDGTNQADLLLIRRNSPLDKKAMQLVSDTDDITEFRSIKDDSNLLVDNILTMQHSTGNVGIGKTGPGAKLDVNGNVRAENTLSFYPSDAYSSAQTRSINLYPKYTSGGSQDAVTAQINLMRTSTGDNTYDGELSFWTRITGFGLAEAVRINKLGNVGIGTATPSSKFHIYSGGGADGALIVESSDTVGYVGSKILKGSDSFWMAIDTSTGSAFNTGTANAGVLWRNGANPISFVTNSVERMRILGTGNVGIGTTSPGAKLEINSPDTANFYPLALTSGVIGTDTNTVGMRFGYTGNTYQKGAIIFEGKDANGRGKLHFAMDGNANNANADLADSKVTIQYDGNVGIGTTGPARTLHVNSLGNTVTRISSSGADSIPTLEMINDAQSWLARIDGSDSDKFKITDDTGTPTDVLTMTTSGNVGIGTTSPATSLHTLKAGGSTNSPNTALILDYESDTTALDGAGTAILFRGKSSGGDIPNYDQARIRSVAQNSNNAHGIAFDFKPNAGTGLTEAMRIHTNGDVGIGTNSPQVRLHIFSNSDTNILRLQDSDGTCSQDPEAGAIATTCSSDIRLKKNIRDAPSALEEISKFKVREFELKATNDTQVGVIAQELQNALPEYVSKGDEGYYQVEEVNSWKLVKAVQELNSKVKELELKIKELEKNKQSS